MRLAFSSSRSSFSRSDGKSEQDQILAALAQSISLASRFAHLARRAGPSQSRQITEPNSVQAPGHMRALNERSVPFDFPYDDPIVWNAAGAQIRCHLVSLPVESSASVQSAQFGIGVAGLMAMPDGAEMPAPETASLLSWRVRVC